MASSGVVFSKDQQLALSRSAQPRSLPTGYVFRARLILMLAEGTSYSAIKQRLRTTAPSIRRWKQRFPASGSMVWIRIIPGRRLHYLPAA
jgi:hypothetical protein